MNDRQSLTKDDGLREEASRRVHDRLSFRRHLLVYLVFIALFWVMWAIGDRSLPPWPVWVTLGWGIGVALQAVSVFGRPNDVESLIGREMENMRRSGRR